MDSEDDEDLKQAIALSLGQNHSAGLGQSSKETIDQKSDIQEKPAYGISGLDRKQDEQNRLARKRRAEISPPAPRKRQNEVIRQDHISDLTASPARSEPMPSLQAKPDINHLEEHRGQPRVLQYPRGTIKKTWAFGQPRDGDIKIEEILQKQDLNIAVLSAFQWDVEWLLTKIDMAKTKMIFVMQAKEDAIRQQYRAETSNMPNLRLCFPPMAGQVNCMHSKLQLLFYKEHLRIVIPSANLVPYDWGEGGTMENTVFLIDLPRLSKEAQEATEAQKPLTSFGQELVYFLEAMGLQDDVVQGVLKFDFGGTKHLALIHSIGGSHTGETWRRTGYCGLGRAVKSLGLSCKGPLEVDFVTSSLGSLNDGFLQAIYLAAHGDDGMTEYNWRTSRTVKSRRRHGQSEGIQGGEVLAKLRKSFRIYFPTEETVVNSKGGSNSGGTICLQPKWYFAETFPRSLLRDCKSRREGMLMHNKKSRADWVPQMLFARPQSSTNERCTPWAYVGSANLSESAWGRISQDKSTRAPKLMCRNWECGVLVSVPSSNGEQFVDMEAFETSVSVPMQTPGREYGRSKPWFYENSDFRVS